MGMGFIPGRELELLQTISKKGGSSTFRVGQQFL